MLPSVDRVSFTPIDACLICTIIEILCSCNQSCQSQSTQACRLLSFCAKHHAAAVRVVISRAQGHADFAAYAPCIFVSNADCSKRTSAFLAYVPEVLIIHNDFGAGSQESNLASLCYSHKQAARQYNQDLLHPSARSACRPKLLLLDICHSF